MGTANRDRMPRNGTDIEYCQRRVPQGGAAGPPAHGGAEPARYNSVLQAIVGGANKGVEIAGKIHEEQPTVAKCPGTLKSMRLIRKRVPCGEPPESRRGIYELADNFLRFWYRFEFSKHCWLFSKGGFTKPVVERARREGTVLAGLDELFGL